MTANVLHSYSMFVSLACGFATGLMFCLVSVSPNYMFHILILCSCCVFNINRLWALHSHLVFMLCFKYWWALNAPLCILIQCIYILLFCSECSTLPHILILLSRVHVKILSHLHIVHIVCKSHVHVQVCWACVVFCLWKILSNIFWFFKV